MGVSAHTCCCRRCLLQDTRASLPQFELRGSGSSLLRPIPRHRTLVVLNTGMYRGWWQEPFAVLHNGFMLLYDDVSSTFALVPFGSEETPATTQGTEATVLPPYAAFNFHPVDRSRNLWPQLGQDEKQAWLSLVRGRAYLQRVLLAGYVGRGSHWQDGVSLWHVV